MDRPPVGDVDDLATLAKLDEQILLGELRERYRRGRIYTYVGDILIAVNPYKDIGIYGKNEAKKYRGGKKSNNPPHIFAIADATYQSLLGQGGRLPSNQCILISGESGAGKTESTKLIIKQLISLCGGNVQSSTAQLEQQILQVNPLLEAFGNAQTNMNDNSSRFGKYIQLKFRKGLVMGAKISEYLLEKSRVVRQSPGEENFHIFHYLFAGLSPEQQDKFVLRDVAKFRYLSNGAKVLQKKGGILKGRYEELCNAMDLVGFTDEEQLEVFTVIASVLHLGNIRFDSNEQDAAVLMDPNGAVKVASMLLQVDPEEVEACLTSMVTVIKGEYVKQLYSKQQAEDARDAMAKTLYGRLFGWIVNKINCLLAPEEDIPPDEVREIGILDIFGFEHFELNSFEQACINLANEQLQFFFNEHIFKMEQEEYIREGIDWKEIKFVDNKPLLDMFLTKPIGLLALLDEESMFPKATDQTYVEKITSHFKKNQYFGASQQTRSVNFSVNHYAGKVEYDATRWLEKNRDTLPSGIMEILTSSNTSLVKTIFRAQITRTGSLSLQGRTLRKSSRLRKVNPDKIRAKRKVTVGAQFKTSLNILMERMQSATPVFVRCLKPNHVKKPEMFMDEYILAQLLYTGMLETTKIRREGFAVRPLFQDFVDKYKILLCQHKLKGSSDNCKKILKASGLSGWHIGKTKVFLKYWHIEQLADILERIGKSARVLQKLARGFVARRRVARLRQAAVEQRHLVEGLLQQIEQLCVTCSLNHDRIRQEDVKKPKDKNKTDQLQPPAVPLHSPTGSITSYLKPQAHTVSCGTGMDDDDDDADDEVMEDDFKADASNRNKFGAPGRKATTIWFQSTQTENVVEPQSGKFAQWFHGIISRKQSEVLLKGMPVGCYLIRVSESRFGYTLSFRAEDRSRHYMIDQIRNGKFIILGESKVHRSLHDIIEYHKTHHISNWKGLLTEPCGQSGDCDYMDLVDESSRMYFILDPSASTSGTSRQSGASSPGLPPRNYTVQRESGQSRMAGRPLPQVPPQVPPQSYQRLIQNQEEQHKYNPLQQTSGSRVRLSTTRNRLH
ncbi:myosin-IIIb-like isoform X2 [Haliotis rufescens]|uniref:myosin-IIIb-like isoform X2 n=1 Tax=Haliotis rufescens TaxID=6454 RepID=UPI00201F7980|nr:myosin-IIIb-like isoform X2 [Haliotis rufescens]